MADSLTKQMRDQLATDQPFLEDDPSNGVRQWVFASLYADQTAATFPQTFNKDAVVDHRMLGFQQSAIQANLIEHAKDYTDKQIEDQLMAALMLAQSLEYIHRYHLNSSAGELRALRDAQAFYKRHLRNIQDIPDKATAAEEIEGVIDGIDKTEDYLRSHRKKMYRYDWYRLLLLRSRRLLALSIVVMTSYGVSVAMLSQLDMLMRPLALYQAALLLPRFISNLWHVASHVIAPSPHEAHLSAFQRFRAHMDMEGRWWEMGYDAGWITAGILNAFVWTGALVPMIAITGVILPTYNFTIHTIRYVVEKRRVERLKDEYRAELAGEDVTDERREVLNDMIASLDGKLNDDLALLYHRMWVTAFIVLAMSTSLAFIAVTPIIPLCGAILGVLVTLAAKYFKPTPTQRSSIGSLEQALAERARQQVDTGGGAPQPAPPPPVPPADALDPDLLAVLPSDQRERVQLLQRASEDPSPLRAGSVFPLENGHSGSHPGGPGVESGDDEETESDTAPLLGAPRPATGGSKGDKQD